MNSRQGKRAATVSRRDFLKGSAAAVGFPYLIASSAMGNAGAVAPSNRIVMGAIGVGGQGTRHVGGGIWVQGGGF
ncbi:MAG: twin-arginine translocation signal domain-containing protein, partial [Planctomycetota bacterium]